MSHPLMLAFVIQHCKGNTCDDYQEKNDWVIPVDIPR
jgi:hypothetical protein